MPQCYVCNFKDEEFCYLFNMHVLAILHIHAFLVILFLFKTQTKIPYIELLYEFYFLM